MRKMPHLVLVSLGACLLMSGKNGLADQNSCQAEVEHCNKIIQVSEKELEMKDLVIKKQEVALRIIQAQRDAAYDLARKSANSSPFLTLVVGAGAGCIMAGEKAELRIACGAAAALACILGGC